MAAVIAVVAGVRAGICMIARAEPDAPVRRRDPRQRRHRVGAPRLRGPHRVEAEPLRLLRQRDGRDRVVVPELQPEAHAAILLLR